MGIREEIWDEKERYTSEGITEEKVPYSSLEDVLNDMIAEDAEEACEKGAIPATKTACIARMEELALMEE